MEDGEWGDHLFGGREGQSGQFEGPLVWPGTLALPCAHSLVCITEASGEEVAGAVTVEVPGRGRGISEHNFAYQVPDC